MKKRVIKRKARILAELILVWAGVAVIGYYGVTSYISTLHAVESAANIIYEKEVEQ